MISSNCISNPSPVFTVGVYQHSKVVNDNVYQSIFIHAEHSGRHVPAGTSLRRCFEWPASHAALTFLLPEIALVLSLTHWRYCFKRSPLTSRYITWLPGLRNGLGGDSASPAHQHRQSEAPTPPPCPHAIPMPPTPTRDSRSISYLASVFS